MTFWRNVLPNILLQGQNAVLVVKKTPQNFYQCIVESFYQLQKIGKFPKLKGVAQKLSPPFLKYKWPSIGQFDVYVL